MSEPNYNDDIRRRLERLEQIQGELQALLRESTLMTSRLNETISDQREEFKQMRSELKELRQLELDVANLKLGFSAVKWFAAAVASTAILMVISYIFQGKVGGP